MNHKRGFVLMNHELLKSQIRELNHVFKIQTADFCYLPESLRAFWRNISPAGSLPVEWLSEIIDYLAKQSDPGDYIVVQGDFGCTYFVVNWAFQNNRIPLYATTRRDAREVVSETGVEIKRFFVHDHFRKYEEYRGN